MDISAYLASVQDNPQSAALAKNIMQPGIPSPDGSSTPEASTAPAAQPSASEDTGPVTGGFDQAQMGMQAPVMPALPTAPPPTPQGDTNEQGPQYAEGGEVDQVIPRAVDEHDEIDENDDMQAHNRRISREGKNDSYIDRGFDNVDDRRRDVVTPQQYKSMSDEAHNLATNVPGGASDDMLAGSRRIAKGPAGYEGSALKFDEGGDVEPAIPEPPAEADAPGIPTKESVNAEGLPATGISQAVGDGFKKIYADAGVNVGVPTPQVEHSARAMMQGAGATPAPQAEAAIEANGGNSGKAVKAVSDFFKTDKGDASKDITALHDYASDKIDPNPTPGHGRSDFEDMGAKAAAGMLQHIRTKFNQTAALATAAPDPNKKGEIASLAFDKYVPDGSKVQVAPTGNGYNVSVDGKNTPVSSQQLDHMLATPFDVIAHMGMPHTIANLQNVGSLQHMSGQPQQAPGQEQGPPMPSAALTKAGGDLSAAKTQFADLDNKPNKGIQVSSMGRHEPHNPLGPSYKHVEAGVRNAQSQYDQLRAKEYAPSTPAPDTGPETGPITIVRGGGYQGSNRPYSPTTVQQVERGTGKVIPEPTEHTRVADIAAKARTGQEQIRQQGLNQRAAEGSASPHGREAQLKMQRERQALTAANAELKEAADAGKPLVRADVYKKYGLEHLLQQGGGAAPKDGEIRVINGRKMRADVQKGGWVPAE